MARTPVQLRDLYENQDPDYLLFVDAVTGRVAEIHEQAKRDHA